MMHHVLRVGAQLSQPMWAHLRRGSTTRSALQTSMLLHRRGVVRSSSSKPPSSSSLSAALNSEEKVASPVVGYWLLGMGGLVAGMVAVGGITRVTRSGLSMTDWTLRGSLPPMNREEWEKEFERYKQFPEWQQRQRMTLEEFKFIYFWEYGHRMMGRMIGVAFAVPLAFFTARGMIPRSMYPRMGLLFGLGGAQGLIGWWMVKSGLDLDPKQRKEIRVSPYRLATHLGMAFTTYTCLIWTALDVLNPAKQSKAVAATLASDIMRHAQKLRRFAAFNGAVVAATVLSGAFVAGNDAGRAYNTFPLMGDQLIPDEILEMQPIWRNFFENTATVQFDHRVLATTALASIGTMYATARTAAGGAAWKSLPSATRLAMNAVAGMSVVQVSLGIATLLLYVPTTLAVVHQVRFMIYFIPMCPIHFYSILSYSILSAARACFFYLMSYLIFSLVLDLHVNDSVFSCFA